MKCTWKLFRACYALGLIAMMALLGALGRKHT